MRRTQRAGNSTAARRRANLRAARRILRRQREQKASAFSALGAMGFTSDGMSGIKRDYRAFAQEAYTRCVIAYRASSLISRGVGMVEWFVTIDEEIVEDPANSLVRLLERPNPSQGTCAFFETMAAWVLLAGNSYPMMITSKTESIAKGRAKPLELHVLRADRVQIETDDKTNQITGYTYQVGNNKTFYPVDVSSGQSQVLHLTTFNPIDDLYGLSPVEPGSYGIDQHNAGNEWNYRLLKNSARPSGVLEHDPGDSGAELTEDQRDSIDRMIRDNNQGESNAGRMLLLEGYLKWKQMGLSPVDMDFSNTMSSAARQVATAYGVPPMLVGIPGDATYANYKEARLALWEDTILPLVRHIQDELNNWLAPMYGDNVKIISNIDNVPAIAERQVSLWEKLENSNFLKLNEKREAAGYDDIEGGDILLVSAGKFPLESMNDEETEDDPDDIIEDDEMIDEEVDNLTPEEAGKMGYGR